MQAAVLPAKGIGDALLMMIASHQLKQAGYEVVTYHKNLLELEGWFTGGKFSKQDPLQDFFSKEFDPATLVIFENDNGARYKILKTKREEGKLTSLSIFYPTYKASKHGPLADLDQVFDPTKTMAENIGLAIAKLIGKKSSSKENGLTPPVCLRHRHFKNRVLIHPTSSTPKKNWTLFKYIQLAKSLQEEGWEPVFVLNPQERDELSYLEQEGVLLPLFKDLAALASFVFESGSMIGNDSLVGHLASNLNIPTLIIADNKERMELWRPGWLEGKLITAPSYLPNWRGFRIKERHWQKFVSCRRVLKAFRSL